MCCLITVMLLLGPRAAIIIWWLVSMPRWSATFTSFIWPLLGFIFLPWTLLAYVLVFPGGIIGFDWVWLAGGFILDLIFWTGGFRRRLR